MKFGKVLLYIAVLVAVAAYVYFGEIKGAEKRKAEEEKANKIIHVKKDAIDGFKLVSKEHGTIELTKPTDQWVLTEPVKVKADEHAVKGWLRSVTDAEREKLLKEKDVDWTEYGLDDPRLTVHLHTKDKTVKLLFGEKNPAKTSYYVRVGDSPKLLLVADTLKNSLDKSTYDLRDKTVLAMAPEDINRYGIQKGDESVELERVEPKHWRLVKPEQFKAKLTVVQKDTRNLTNMNALDIIDNPEQDGNPYGFDDPTAVIALSGEKLDQKLIVGAPKDKADPDKPKTEPREYYAKVDGRDTVYVIPARTVNGLTTDIKQIRDRSVFSFEPTEVEKFDLTIDGRKWSAEMTKDGSWKVTAPKTIENAQAWRVTTVVWDFRDMEWTSLKKPVGDDLSEFHLDEPRLTASFHIKGREKPVTFKAGWEAVTQKADDKKSDPAAEDGPTSETSGAKKDNAEQAPEKPAPMTAPKKFYAIADPQEEKDAVMVIEGDDIQRLQADLEIMLVEDEG